MTTNPIKDLMAMDKKDVLALCKKHSLPVDGRASKEVMIEVLLKAYNPDPVQQKLDAQMPDVLKPTVPTYDNTEAEVRDALDKLFEKSKYRAARNHFVVSFLDDGMSWHFQYGKKEDTGSMNIPLITIVRRAEFVMSGALPRDITAEGFDPNVTSRYSNIVLPA